MHALKLIKWVLISTGATFLVLSSLLVFSYWHASYGVFSSESFENTKWHAAISDEQSATCYRGGMASDIQGLLSNKMTENDVAVLLGEPSEKFIKQEYQYSLGMCSGLGIDYDYLHIYFDEHGHFSHTKITQH